MSRLAAAAVVGAGIAAAFHVGKLPPAIGVLRNEFGISLVQASYLVSVLQMAALALGIVGGVLADRFGPKRVMSFGLVLLVLASAAGAFAESARVLLGTRVIESVGFMLCVLPGPSLLRRSVSSGLNRWLGLWAAYMPAGMALGLLITPFLIGEKGWRSAWWLACLFSLFILVMIRRTVAEDRRHSRTDVQVATLLSSTLAAPGPWLLGMSFGCYAAQWMGVFAFLPTIYADAGIAASAAAPLTAFAVAINILGNLTGGFVAQRRVSAPWLIVIAALAMAGMSWIAFGSGAQFQAQYLAIVVLSMVGGLIPGALFAMAPVLAPSQNAVSTTVGLMQQGSAAGQMLAPPIIAAMALSMNGWTGTWKVTGLFALGNLVVAFLLFQVLTARTRSTKQMA